MQHADPADPPDEGQEASGAVPPEVEGGPAEPHDHPRVFGGPPRGPSESTDLVAFLSRTAGGLVHEIKNPLSTIAINLALLEEDWNRGRRTADGEASLREKRSLKRVGTLKREVARLEQIVEEFLSFVRGAEINRRPCDLGAIVRDVLDFVETEDESLAIRHHVDLPVGLPLVMLDESALRQALLNLFVNARQAMPEGGELLVRLVRHGNHAQLSVTDTGLGMRPEALEKCFDVFWSDKKNGSGLGLATAKRIVEEHGGSITVLSEEHCGTSFTVYLPLAVELTHSRRAEPRLDLDATETRPAPGHESQGHTSSGRESSGRELPGGDAAQDDLRGREA